MRVRRASLVAPAVAAALLASASDAGGEAGGGTQTLRGTVTAAVAGLPCPLRAGNAVRVADASHAVVAEGRLGVPERSTAGRVATCSASFEVAGLPRAEASTVRMANAAATYSHGDLVRLGWTVRLSAGQRL